MVLEGLSRRQVEDPGPETLEERFAPGSFPAEPEFDSPAEPAGARPKKGRPCRLKSRTTREAPDGTSSSRNTVGPGEEVTFKANRRSDWAATAGTRASEAPGREFVWRAPEVPGRALVRATPVGRRAPCTIAMTTIKPSRIEMKKLSEGNDGPAGTAGAHGWFLVSLPPESVSFHDVRWREIRDEASNVEGYFRDLEERGANLCHCAAREEGVRINTKNTWKDEVKGLGFRPPWYNGSFEWVIPNRYQVVGGSADYYLTTTVQRFTIDESGTVTITKGGDTITGRPNPPARGASPSPSGGAAPGGKA